MSSTVFPQDFLCEHTPTKSRVFAMLAIFEGPHTLKAVLTCADPALAQRAADALSAVARGVDSPVLSSKIEQVLDDLPTAPAASFRQALQWLYDKNWPAIDIGPSTWRDRSASSTPGPVHDQGPNIIEAEFGPNPDFAALFPAEDCDCEQENCHICTGWQLTPRTADLLYTALEALADQAFDDIEEHGSEPVEKEDRGDWSVFNRLPRITWNQDAEWRRQIARACDDLTDDLVRGEWPTPRNNAEEIVLHLAIHDGPDWEEEKDDIEDEAHEALPRHSRDYDWDMCSEILFQDHDILMLYDESLDGIENPGNDANRHLRMGDLRPAAWFEYFANVEPRDPARGFRR